MGQPVRDELDAFEISLLAAGEYGRSWWPVRRFLVRAAVLAALGAVSLAVRLLHPLHPYRVYVEGTVALHRDLVGRVLVAPRRRPTRMRQRATVAVLLASVWFAQGAITGFTPLLDRL